MSKKDLVLQYYAMKREDYPTQECVSCGQMMARDSMDRHHPAGRFGTNILKYVYLCRTCHAVVHDDPKGATERGLLWPRRNTHLISDEQWIELIKEMKENQYSL